MLGQFAEEALLIHFLDQVDEEELGARGDGSLALHVVFLELGPIHVILLPGTRLGRVERVKVEEQSGLELGRFRGHSA